MRQSRIVDFELYGGKRAYIAHLRERALYAFGAYRSARSIEWTAVARLVFVCQGNICRSPYASARARALGITAISCGLDATEGAGADPAASRNAMDRGIDLSTHRSARLRPSFITQRDLIVVFEPKQMMGVMRCGISGLAGVTLLGIWSPPIRPHIQDPYGRSDRYFQQCFSGIDACVQEMMRRLVANEALARAGGMSGASCAPSVPTSSPTEHSRS